MGAARETDHKQETGESRTRRGVGTEDQGPRLDKREGGGHQIERTPTHIKPMADRKRDRREERLGLELVINKSKGREHAPPLHLYHVSWSTHM